MRPSFLINSLHGGGAEKQLSTLIEHFSCEKVYTLEKSPGGPENLIELSSHSQHTPALIKLLSLGYYSKKLARQTAGGETVISFMTRANAVNTISAARSGHRAIVSERTNPSREFSGLRKRLYSGIIRKTYSQADLIVTNSLGVAEEISRSFGAPQDKIRTIANHLNLKKIKELAAEPLGEYEKLFSSPVITTSGRLTAAKGQWRLIKIFSELKKRQPDLRLAILGSGELKEYLKDLAEALDLRIFDAGEENFSDDRDVYFLGSAANPYNFLSRSRLFVLTSLWEGLPNALLEAMACGAPCVSANCQYGPLEIFSIKPELSQYASRNPSEEDFGILLPVLNAQKITYASEAPDEAEKIWIDCLDALLKDEKKLSLYSELGKARAADFDLAKILPLWERIADK